MKIKSMRFSLICFFENKQRKTKRKQPKHYDANGLFLCHKNLTIDGPYGSVVILPYLVNRIIWKWRICVHFHTVRCAFESAYISVISKLNAQFTVNLWTFFSIDDRNLNISKINVLRWKGQGWKAECFIYFQA